MRCTTRPRTPPQSSTSSLLNNVEITDWINVYGLFRDYVKHEDGLINNRLLWILTIHGFLYATYGFTVQKKLEVAHELANDTSGFSHHAFLCYLQGANLAVAIAQIELFIVCIGLVGLCISFIGLISIRAAGTAQNSIRDIFNFQFNTFNRQQDNSQHTFLIGTEGRQIIVPSITGGGVPGAHGSGLISPVFIPVILLISWAIALTYSGWYIYHNLDYVEAIFWGINGCHTTAFSIMPPAIFVPLHTI